MTHSFKVHPFHLVWSTKDRRPLIIPEIEARLYGYMCSIINDYKANLLEINGMPDHIHLLIQLPNLEKHPSLIRDLKACSSSWIKKSFSDFDDFWWQEGFGSFCVSPSNIPQVRKYIQDQKIHHQKYTYEQEYIRILEKNGVKYDPRFVFG